MMVMTNIERHETQLLLGIVGHVKSKKEKREQRDPLGVFKKKDSHDFLFAELFQSFSLYHEKGFI